MSAGFLPITPEEAGGQLDFALVTGDAYVDHPSFGAAVIGRLLAAHGFSVGVIAQPDCDGIGGFMRLGRPRLGFLVTGGNIDSMLANYYVSGARRGGCDYSPGGVAGRRPNRAAIVYSNKIREAYRDAAIILGGLEASLRRLAHYDFHDDAVRRSLLLDAGADILVYGMGELAVVAIAEALDSGLRASDIVFVPGTVYKAKDVSAVARPVFLPKFGDISQPTPKGKAGFAKSFALQYAAAGREDAGTLVEEYPGHFVVQNPPSRPLSTGELDRLYSFPYMRRAHPVYDGLGGVPAIQEVKFGITALRGCFGGCNFCSIAFHQGRRVTSRSAKSVLREAEGFLHDPDFKGYVHDVGGPTANFYGAECKAGRASCTRKCLGKNGPCKNLNGSHGRFMELLAALRALPGIKKVFVRSGIRLDHALSEPDGGAFIKALCEHHVSGRLKIAPEHSSARVLAMMGKPGISAYEEFSEKFRKACKELGRDYYIVPYFMSSHPGSGLGDAIALAEYMRDNAIRPEQVQDFYPTPGTVSGCMYYSGINPLTMERVKSPRTKGEKAAQRALMQYWLPANYDIVKGALLRAGRKDLIGYSPKALLRPRKPGLRGLSSARGNRGGQKKGRGNNACQRQERLHEEQP